MKIPRTAVGRVVEALLECPEAKTVSLYLEPRTVVKATRIHKHTRRSDRYGAESYMLTIGRPNFLGRRFVKQCQQAGEPFPVRKLQIKWWPKKRGVK